MWDDDDGLVCMSLRCYLIFFFFYLNKIDFNDNDLVVSADCAHRLQDLVCRYYLFHTILVSIALKCKINIIIDHSDI